MRALRPALAGADLLTPAVGAAVTLLAVYVTLELGADVGLGLLLVLGLFLAFAGGFLLAPHFTVAVMIPLFALLPAMKVLVAPWIGPLKDLVGLAAILAAAGILVLQRSRRRAHVDGPLLALVGLLLGLYVVNVGGGHGIAWLQGVRLTGEPLLLLVAGMALPEPRRTLRWAVASLVGTAGIVALYGLWQQDAGVWRLHDLGYEFDVHIRTTEGKLRSFGTLDDPFAYAALLLAGLAAIVFGLRRSALAWVLGGIISLGVYFSYVRTAGLVALGLFGLLLARRGNGTSAALVAVAAVATALTILATAATGSESRSLQAGENRVVTLNDRVSAWSEALGPPLEWPFGRGVGEVGTAAQRATYEIAPATDAAAPTRAVDSGYLATIADVGLVGLVVLLALLGRLAYLAYAAIRRGRRQGWLAASLLAVLLLDAVTRASFTGFPTAFLGLFLIGLSLAAAAAEGSADRPRRPEPAPATA